ncbi:MAG: Dam family site-specific DNA-(adenine-N6)-methyltransferase [Cyanobacteria bacterium HKST-UBA03]|nr:Dam family site-specific DNA-(adenine-N6)-methyltransferase [Cyanobacteria bacterium HKST-UBA03]
MEATCPRQCTRAILQQRIAFLTRRNGVASSVVTSRRVSTRNSALSLAKTSQQPETPSGSPCLAPPLKWAGGKRWLVSTLQPMFAAHENRRLVEPFCGGLSVALGLRPERALLNDHNPHLVNFYTQLQQGLAVTHHFKNDSTYYYMARTRFNRLIEQDQANTPEAASLFYYLNRTGYNGLCRFNKKGFYNVPFGKYATLSYRPDFYDYRQELAPWVFTNHDFEALVVTENDWVYADPPYDESFTAYGAAGFSWADQERLAHWLAQLPCPVVLSNLATDRIVALYKRMGFELQFVQGPRSISCNSNREAVCEVLAHKP